MDSEIFSTTMPGKLVPTINGQKAFVPNPLPPKLDQSPFLFGLSETMQALGELKGVCRRLQNPYVLIGPLQRREALTSSAMEGTHTSADELALLEAGARRSTDDDTKEVHNFIRAIRLSLDSLEELPISLRILKNAHQRLMVGLSAVRGANKLPGEFKRDQNWIDGRTIEEARFVPAPPTETENSMGELEAYINRESRYGIHDLVDLALIHYQFETIHPFTDGNGRLGRMLVSLIVVERGLLDLPVLYLSPFLEKEKSKYIDLMFNVSTKGDWAPWIEFFLEAIRESCVGAINTIDDLIALQEEYRSRAAALSRSSNLQLLVDSLFERPVLTIPMVQGILDVTYRGARQMVEKLVEGEILTEIEYDSPPKVYVAPKVLEISIGR